MNERKILNSIAKLETTTSELKDTTSKISLAVINLDERLEKVEDRMGSVEGKVDQLITGNDKVIKILNRMEAGLAGSVSRDDRIGKRVDLHDVEIKSIKTQLKIA